MANQIPKMQQGPCGSGVRWGSPTFTSTPQGPESTVVYMVPSNMLCCFYKTIFGQWTVDADGLIRIPTVPDTDVYDPPIDYPKWALPCQIKRTGNQAVDPLDQQAFIAVSASVLPGENVGPISGADIKAPTGDIDDWIVFDKNGDQCWLAVSVTYRMVRRVVTAEYWIKEEEDCTQTPGVFEVPVQVDWPAHIIVEKESGVDFRTVETPGIVFCPISRCLNVTPDTMGTPDSAQFIRVSGSTTTPAGDCRAFCIDWSLGGTGTDIVVNLSVDGVTEQTANYAQLASPVTNTWCFETDDPSVPVTLVAVFNDGGGSMTLNATMTGNIQSDNLCCTTQPDSPKAQVPFATDRIQVTWVGTPSYNDSLIKSLVGKCNLTGFLGYPAYGLNFIGYDVRQRFNVMGQAVSDIGFQFIAKTADANGETNQYLLSEGKGGFLLEHECVNGRVGIWNRSYCDTRLKDTTQHFQHLCDASGQPLIPGAGYAPSTLNSAFWEMFELNFVTV